MENDVRTTIYVDRNLHTIVRSEGMNLSRFVNEQLEIYFSVATVDDVQRQIDDLDLKKIALERKRADLVSRGTAETKDEGIRRKTWVDLRQIYVERRKRGMDPSGDLDWICSPKNLQRLKVLDMSTNQVLEELERWYQDEQRN